MTGWRCGFVVGNELLVKAYGDVKDNTDSGQFLAIQHASAYCFDHPEITEKIAAKYSRRMDGLVQVLEQSWVQCEEAARLIFPLRQSAQSGREKRWFASRIQERRRSFAVADHGKVDFDRAVG